MISSLLFSITMEIEFELRCQSTRTAVDALIWISPEKKSRRRLTHQPFGNSFLRARPIHPYLLHNRLAIATQVMTTATKHIESQRTCGWHGD